MSTSSQICFAASHELVEALDLDAFNNDQSRAARIRAVLVEHVRGLGLMDDRAPATAQLAQNNRLFHTRGGRR